MTRLVIRGGRPMTLRETVMVSFGIAMIVVLGAHVGTWVVGHAFAPQSLAYSEIALGVASRVANRVLGGS